MKLNKLVGILVILIFLVSTTTAVPDKEFQRKDRIAGILLNKILNGAEDNIPDRLVKLQIILNKLELRGFEMTRHQQIVNRELSLRNIDSPVEEEPIKDKVCEKILEDLSINIFDGFTETARYQFIPRIRYNDVGGAQTDEIFSSFNCEGNNRAGKNEIEVLTTWTNIPGQPGFSLEIFRQVAQIDADEFGFNYIWEATFGGKSKIKPDRIEGDRHHTQNFEFVGTPQEGDKYTVTLKFAEDDAIDTPIGSVTWNIVVREPNSKDNSDFNKIFELAKQYLQRGEIAESQAKDDTLQTLVYNIARPGLAGPVKPHMAANLIVYEAFREKLIQGWVQEIKETNNQGDPIRAQLQLNGLKDKHRAFCTGISPFSAHPCAQDITDLDQLLGPGQVRIKGKIFDSDGAPVHAASVTLTLDPPATTAAISPTRISVTSQRDGTYTFSALSPAGKYILSAEIPGKYNSEKQSIEVKDGQIIGNTFLILGNKGTLTSVISGRVFDKDTGKNVEIKDISIVINPDGRKDISIPILTNSDGRFTVDVNLPSPARGYIFKTDNIASVTSDFIDLQNEAVFLSESDSSKFVDIPVQAKAIDKGSIKVKVVDEGDQIIAGALVKLSSINPGISPITGRTDNLGIFNSDRIDAGRYLVSAQFVGFAENVPIDTNIGIGETKEVKVTLPGISNLKGVIEGVVRDGNGKIVDLVVNRPSITLTRNGVDVPLTPLANLFVNKDRYRIKNLDLNSGVPTEFIVTVSIPTFVDASKPVEVIESKVGNGNIVLANPGLQIAGVVKKQGFPIDGVELKIANKDTATVVGDVTTINGGLFSRSNVRDGVAYTIELRGDSLNKYHIVGSEDGKLNVIAKRNSPRLEIEIIDLDSAQGRISVYVLDLKSSNPIPSADIFLGTGANPQLKGTTTDLNDQHIEIRSLPINKPSTTYTITARATNYGEVSEKVTLTPSDRSKVIRLKLPRLEAEFVKVAPKIAELDRLIGRTENRIGVLEKFLEDSGRNDRAILQLSTISRELLRAKNLKLEIIQKDPFTQNDGNLFADKLDTLIQEMEAKFEKEAVFIDPQ